MNHPLRNEPIELTGRVRPCVNTPYRWMLVASFEAVGTAIVQDFPTFRITHFNTRMGCVIPSIVKCQRHESILFG